MTIINFTNKNAKFDGSSLSEQTRFANDEYELRILKDQIELAEEKETNLLFEFKVMKKITQDKEFELDELRQQIISAKLLLGKMQELKDGS